jgi:hypothetical protein
MLFFCAERINPAVTAIILLELRRSKLFQLSDLFMVIFIASTQSHV